MSRNMKRTQSHPVLGLMKTGYPPEAYPPIVNIRCIKLKGKLSILKKPPQLRNTRLKNLKHMKYGFAESQLSQECCSF